MKNGNADGLSRQTWDENDDDVEQPGGDSASSTPASTRNGAEGDVVNYRTLEAHNKPEHVQSH